MENPYTPIVEKFAAIFDEGRACPLGGFPPLRRPTFPPTVPTALIFSPHPDDECIVGALATRLLAEGAMRVANVAVTQGSRKDRQQARFQELTAACRYLGFGVIRTGPGGLERISRKGRAEDPRNWAEAVAVIRRILSEQKPKVVFLPHDADWNSTHIGTHDLVMDALKALSPPLPCYLVETEYWQPMADPNLMMEVSADLLATHMAALSFHVGEVQRNPYHLILPAWMMDNVRRGAELVGGQGQAAPDYRFAILYRVRRWTGSDVAPLWSGGKQVSRSESVGALFPE